MSADPKNPTVALRVFALILLLAVICAAGLALLYRNFPPGLSQNNSGTALPIDAGPLMAGTATSAGDETAMSIQLSEGQPEPESATALPPISGEPLSAAQIDEIFSRLPDLPLLANEQVDFKFPLEVLPPPRPGVTVSEQFPPLETEPTPGVPDSGPLQVLRHAPEGEIPVAPFISITFNQPMVPLGTLADLAASDSPAQISPALPGTWRWLGTKTLTFETDSSLYDRLPKATRFQVNIPAGTKSATGGTLETAVSWSFTTPPAQIVTSAPAGDSQPLEPVFFIAFDQRVDPQAVLATVSVSANGRPVSVRMASAEELKKDAQASRLAENAPEGRWLAFKASAALPANSEIAVTVGPGTPSAEGPLVTQSAQTFSFRTYAPLKIVEYGCSWYNQDCPPLTPFEIHFNNPLDEQTFSADMLRINPEIPGSSINFIQNTLIIKGETRGQTKYTVTISGNIRDVYGQKLGQETNLTFSVGKADPALIGPQQNFITLDPQAAKPVFSVYAINQNRVDVKIYAVQPADWDAYRLSLRDWSRNSDGLPRMPGSQVLNQTLNLDLPSDTLSQVDINLGDYTRAGFGHFIVILQPARALIESDNDKWRRISQTVIAWVQVTQLGLDAFNDDSQMTAWVTNLKDGAPLAGVSLQTDKNNLQIQTDSDGVARFKIPDGSQTLIATRGADSALLPRSIYPWSDEAWTTLPINDSLRWYVFDDRKMYRPGEEIHLKGWIRRIGGKPDGDVSLVGDGISSISYQITDPQGIALGGGQAAVNALGGFDFVFTIPQATNLGSAQIFLTANGALSGLENTQYNHIFQIQEFRRPEFEVQARNETGAPYFAGGHALLSVAASYYAGGALPNAEVTWQVNSAPGNYSPPNWPDFSFGIWQPWWLDWWGNSTDGNGEFKTFSGKTDAAGFHYLRLDFPQQGQPPASRPLSITAQANVMDVNRQSWASTTTLLIHPADVYVGLRTEHYFVAKGTPLQVDFIVTDLDGNPVSGRAVEITAARLEWKYRSGAWAEEPVDLQKCPMTSGTEPDSCEFNTPLGGSYKITATVTDGHGRRNQSSFTRWVSGGQMPPSRTVKQETVTLIPDRQTYQPGETAQILVQSPFSPAEGLLTVSRSGTLYTRRFRIENGSTTLQIPIETSQIPNLIIQVDLSGAAPRTSDQGESLPNLPPRPAFASGTLNLSIPPLSRTLTVQVTPDQNRLEPGGGTTLSVLLKDANGQPVADAELAVVVVDEAILALTSYQLVDPLTLFYAERDSRLTSLYARSSLILSDPQALADAASMRAVAAAPMPMATMTASEQSPGASTAGSAPIRVRADFNPLAAFAPSVRTSLDGSARIPIHLPDNLTRYRIMVIAVDSAGNKFGTGESNLTARLPLMVRPSAPRFLNFGDQFSLPVVLQNQTDSPLTVDVAARAANLELGIPGQRVTVPANDRLEVRFPASTIAAGTARIQFAAVAGNYADAASIELPVYTPATSEAFAAYGVLDDGASAQPVQVPTGVFPQYGGLEISTSSTALQALTDAVLYLSSYPYECSEQLASRILAVASLRDVLTAFQAEGLPAPAEMESAISRDIQRLGSLQNSDGGFPYWQRGFSSSPFNSIHTTYALVRASQKGFTVPAEMQTNALAYLRQVESYYPDWYSPRTRWTLSAYALYVRSQAGERDPQKALDLLNEAGLENLSMEAIGWLWPVLDDPSQLDAIRRYVNNHVVETAGAANFTTAYDDQTYLLLSSNRRTDAILLEALMTDNPQSDLIPKLVNGLLAHRTRGHWGSTQENVFVLLALDHYFNTYEAQTPDFVARLWLGDTYAGSSAFHGRSTEQHELSIPMTYVLSETTSGGGTRDLILGKEGPGRLYYRLGLIYAPTELTLPALEMGFVVQRRYEGLDNPADVTQDSAGVWHIRAGARVRVHLTMAADNRRFHVALVDAVPAGLEIVNPALAVSGAVPQDPANSAPGWWWRRTWYEHQNMRDARAEAFTSLLWEGVYEYSYIARATTPGSFIAPPARAEEMYAPEVFGRSASDRVIVEDREQ